jgi:hypothetical protein
MWYVVAPNFLKVWLNNKHPFRFKSSPIDSWTTAMIIHIFNFVLPLEMTGVHFIVSQTPPVSRKRVANREVVDLFDTNKFGYLPRNSIMTFTYNFHKRIIYIYIYIFFSSYYLALQPFVSLGLLCYSPPLVSILSFPSPSFNPHLS